MELYLLHCNHKGNSDDDRDISLLRIFSRIQGSIESRNRNFDGFCEIASGSCFPIFVMVGKIQFLIELLVLSEIMITSRDLSLMVEVIQVQHERVQAESWKSDAKTRYWPRSLGNV